MLANNLKRSPCGKLIPIEGDHFAFVPDPLPRELALPPKLVYRLDIASRAVATLAGVGETLSNPHLLITPFLRREAVLSSRIEGTQASLSDVYAYEASGGGPPERRQDTLEVINYVTALEYGLQRLRDIPISVRLTNEIHERLLSGVRGADTRPGELRDLQVWIGSEGTSIGEARFVPPPPKLVRDLMSDWESFANENIEMPPLVKAALIHYQFEAIHPYRDGNGRIGRLLLVLFLCSEGVLPTPLLYLSAYLERNRSAYYDHLLQVSATGDWTEWLLFFLDGVADQANDAIIRSRRLRELHDIYRNRLQEDSASANMLRLLDLLFVNPYTTVSASAANLGLTKPAVRAILDKLVRLGLVQALPGKWRRVYIARRILDIIEAPTASELVT